MNTISIIIPTHNRSHVLKRCINYYSTFKNCEIIICDSSEKTDSNNFGKIKYFHLPGYTFSQKILYAVQNASCDFICLSADDDFLFENSLKKGYNYLKDNTGYVSVHGYFSGFKISNDVSLYNKPIYPHNNNFQCLEDSPSERIINSMNPYMHLLYSLHPKYIAIECLKFAVNFPEVTNVEISFNIITLIYGKHKTLDIYWMARDSSVYTNYTIEKNSLYSIINDYSIYLPTVNGQKFKRSYTEIYCNNLNILENEAAFIFDNIFNNYFTYLNSINLQYEIKKVKDNYFLNLKTTKIYIFLKEKFYYTYKYLHFYKVKRILLSYRNLI
jgi:glycosyltransferase domain-containing protein